MIGGCRNMGIQKKRKIRARNNAPRPLTDCTLFISAFLQSRVIAEECFSKLLLDHFLEFLKGNDFHCFTSRFGFDGDLFTGERVAPFACFGCRFFGYPHL